MSINEDAVQPESANIRLIVTTLNDPAGGTPSAIRILSVSGGTLWQSNGSSITLGSAGTTLGLTSGKIDLRFRPDAGRDVDATFRYAVVDPHDSSVNSSGSTATISIAAVNDAPVLQTLSGNTGIGLAATYYLEEWDLTGPTFQRIDATVNFSNNFGVTGLDLENFSVRWTGQVESPVTGNVTFSTSTDDGVRLWIDDELIIDNWTLHGETVDTADPVSLVAGEKYDLRLEFYERGGGEVAKLRWAYTGQSTQIIPQAYLYPATTRPSLSYVNGAESAIIDDAVTVSDVDSAFIASGSVVISANYQPGEDSLLFTNQNGIVGSFSGGTLSLTGSASLAHYQAALRSVRYANGDPTPTTDTRTITFTVSDVHGGESNDTYRGIEFTGENTPPVITEGASVSITMDEDATPTPFSLTLNATDADYHSVSWSIATPAAHGTGSVSGNGDSKEISYVPAPDYYGSDSFVVQISDGNGGTDTITVSVTITDRTPPVISAVSATASGSTGVSIEWTTDEATSTKINYGLTASRGTDSSETDTSPRVTSHGRILGSLRPCTTYHYAVVSADATANSATSTGGTFITGGCAGSAEVTASTGTTVISNANGSTGSIVLPGNSVTLVVPSGYVATNATCPSGAVFQLKELEPAPVKTALGSPSGRGTIVTAHNLSAYCPDFTPVTSFDAPLTITFTYADGDIAGLDESSLSLYRYGSGSTAWEALSCSQDAAANTLTCTTTAFSSFGLFGAAPAAASEEETRRRGGGGGGCRRENCKTWAIASSAASDESDRPAAVPSLCSADGVPSRNGRLWLAVDGDPVEFLDVPVSAWFACAVMRVVSDGIFSGYRDARGRPSGLYGPTDPITLGQLAKVASGLAGADVTKATGPDWADAYVAAAQGLKVTVFLDRISPEAPATRGAVIRTLLEVLGIPEDQGDDAMPYSDVPADSPHRAAILTATRLGIVGGDDGADTFRPDEPINRAEVAKMVVLALAAAGR